LLPFLRSTFPNHVLTTKQIGQAMLSVARRGYPKRILESKDIRAAALSPVLPIESSRSRYGT